MNIKQLKKIKKYIYVRKFPKKYYFFYYKCFFIQSVKNRIIRKIDRFIRKKNDRRNRV